MSYLKLVIITTVFIFFAGCSQDNHNLISKRWRPVAVSVALDDSTKNVLFSKTVIEFTKDGKYFINGPRTNDTGTYELSDKGKTLTVSSIVTKRNVEMTIDTLTNYRFVFTAKLDGTKTTVVPL